MRNYDLIIVGTGSGNSIPPELDEWDIALVERDVFGGTCLNRGCIPSKMLIYAADQALHIREAAKYGLTASLDDVDWPGIVKRVFGRIDPIAEGGENYRRDDCDNITVYGDHGAFVDNKVLQVDGEEITADRIILAAGARPFIPQVPGLEDVDYHTSDTIMRIEELPERLAILGGGYIATELGHVFEAFGSTVTMMTRGSRLLRSEDDDISQRFTELSAERFNYLPGTTIEGVDQGGDGTIQVHTTSDGAPHVVEADVLLVAAGRIPNSDQLHVERTGVRVDHAGRVSVDECLRTNVEGIWAFGDLSNHYQLKHVANAEARVVFHNVAHPEDPVPMDYSGAPHAVFSYPQIASVGMTERDASEEGLPYVTATKPFGDTAYGWAMEDTTSFVKVIAHAQTRQLLGAHIIGPQASTLIQPLIQGMRWDTTVDDLARGQMWIHPALTEVVENCLLDL